MHEGARVSYLVLAAVLAAAPAQAATRILFVGNSFTFGATSAVRHYRPESVRDLNRTGVGGVPALFKRMTEQAGLDYDVSLETVGGADLALHWTKKRTLIDKAWDGVVLQSYSTLDAAKPGDDAKLVASVRQIAAALRARNPEVSLYLTATWSRADLAYVKPSPWHGKPIETMATDLRHGYDAAQAAIAPATVIPVGEAWSRAMHEGVADPDPYDGIAFGQVDLWGWDQYHASAYGYYLEALTVFGAVTGADPRSLGETERCAEELGLSPTQAGALQAVAAKTLGK